MLIEFSVENYLSFRERRVLSMQASGLSDFPENVFEAQGGRFKLLKGAVIYGANSSGKSNLIKAFEKMREIITKGRRARRLGIAAHQLFQPTTDKESLFEAIFIIEKKRFRYGFKANNQKIVAEWLYEAEKQAEKMLFIREDQTIEVSEDFSEGKGVEEKTSAERLFIGVVFDFNGETATKIFRWFQGSFIIVSGLNHNRYASTTINSILSGQFKNQITAFYKNLNLGFDNIEIEQEEHVWTDHETGEDYIDVNETPVTYHPVFNNDFNKIGDAKFDLRNQESDGTNKIFNLSGRIFNVINKGGALIIDELDSSLHPLIMITITRLFNSEKTNPHNAQLIYTTHDTNMLHYGNYRRDQIWFTEKDKYGGTDLYSLAEIKDMPRKEANFEEQYIKGRYGAIPYIGDIEKLFEEWHKQVK